MITTAYAAKLYETLVVTPLAPFPHTLAQLEASDYDIAYLDWSAGTVFFEPIFAQSAKAGKRKMAARMRGMINDDFLRITIQLEKRTACILFALNTDTGRHVKRIARREGLNRKILSSSDLVALFHNAHLIRKGSTLVGPTRTFFADHGEWDE